ncbi:hypothetical protein EDD21DRAFT_416769 [Dissophora ornata]|nr:hypothetical protein EDD21DRAFT_416769 [Dissophora ornata]
MSASTQTNLRSAQVFEDYQPGRHESAPRLRRRQSLTEWTRLPGLEIKLEQWSTKDRLQHDEHDRHDPGVGQHGGTWSSTHIIPFPDFDHKLCGDDGGREDGVGLCFPDKRDDHHRRQGRASLCPQTAAPVQPNEHRGLFRGPSGRSAPHTPFQLTMSKITSEHDIQDPKGIHTDPAVDATPDETLHIYTPQPLPISVASTPIWYTEYSSTTSTPAISRQGSCATSPQTCMLQGFLAQHSNGHTMHRRPANSSVDCSDCCQSSESNNIDEGEMDLDDRFFLLAQSPDPNEFEYGEFFMTESQKNARLHQADSPVFFNGFPLLRMTPMDRDR